MENEECRGMLKGDPGIAGIGVVTSIWLTAASSVVISWTFWYLALWQGKTTREKLFRAFTKCAYVLADIHLIAALAIILSSIVLIHANGETSSYHVFTARCLTQANFTGHGAALIFDTRSQSNGTIRIGLLVITLSVYFYWTILSIGEFNGWESHTPKCFYNTSSIPFRYTTWMYIDPPWQAIGWMRLFIEATGECEHHLVRLINTAARLLRGAVDDFLIAFHKRNLMHILRLELVVVQMIAFLIISLTLFPPSTIPFASTFYLIWQSYVIYTVRSDNRPELVASPGKFRDLSLQYNVNPEGDIGSGQLLPWFLFTLPFLQFWDIFRATKEHKSRVSYYLKETCGIWAGLRIQSQMTRDGLSKPYRVEPPIQNLLVVDEEKHIDIVMQYIWWSIIVDKVEYKRREIMLRKYWCGRTLPQELLSSDKTFGLRLLRRISSTGASCYSHHVPLSRQLLASEKEPNAKRGSFGSWPKARLNVSDRFDI